MRADLFIYTGLLGLSLGAAYWASKPHETGDDSKVKILAIDPTNIAAIDFSSSQPTEGNELVVSAKKRTEDSRFDFNVKKTDTPKPKPNTPQDASKKPNDPNSMTDDQALDEDPDSPTPGSSSTTDKNKEKTPSDSKSTPAPQPVITYERFLGNEKMDELLTSLSPLIASRVFTNVDDKQLEEFGLKTPDQKVTITTVDGKTYGFLLGRKSYGSPHRFVLEENGDSKSRRVLLIENGPFESLERAPKRLYDRRYIAEEFENFSKAEVTSPTGIKTKLAHSQKNKEGQLLWTDDEPDAKAKPSYDSFMDRLQKLRLSQYASNEQEAKLKDLPPFLVVSFEKDGKVVDVVSFKKLAGEKSQYFVTSQFLKIHGEIIASRIESLEKDIDSVFKTKKP